MPLSSLFPTDVLNLLALAFGAGLLTQLARQLAGPLALRARRVLACGVLGGVAALSLVALLSAAPTPAPPALLLAAACVGGWSGPRLLGRLGSVIERRLGLGPLPGADGPRPDVWPLAECRLDPLDRPNATDATAAPQGGRAQ